MLCFRSAFFLSLVGFPYVSYFLLTADDVGLDRLAIIPYYFLCPCHSVFTAWGIVSVVQPIGAFFLVICECSCFHPDTQPSSSFFPCIIFRVSWFLNLQWNDPCIVRTFVFVLLHVSTQICFYFINNNISWSEVMERESKCRTWTHTYNVTTGKNTKWQRKVPKTKWNKWSRQK